MANVVLQNERCTVYRLQPSTDPSAAPTRITLLDGPLLLMSAGGTLQEEVSSSTLHAAKGKLHACWDPFQTDEVRLQGVDGTFYAVQVYGCACIGSRGPEGLDRGVRTDVGTDLLIENDLVCVWAFEVEVGAACHVHRHVRDYFFLNILVSDTLALDQNGQPVPGGVSRQEAGQLTFVHVKGPPFPVHGLINVGSETFRQFVVEFKQPLSRL